MTAPTFSEDIAPLFTQYDVIQMKYSFDLRDYEAVKKHADAILLVVQPDPKNPGYSLLPGIPLMPLQEAPWTDEMVATFKAWIDGGYQPGTLPPPPPPITEDLPLFIALSEYLCGFDNLGDNKELAQTYLNKLKAYWSNEQAMTLLLNAYDNMSQLEESEKQSVFEEKIWNDTQLGPWAKDIITAWYNASVGGSLGTPEDNQYIHALCWKAAQAHPMGYADSNVPFYWKFKVEGDQYTGLLTPGEG